MPFRKNFERENCLLSLWQQGETVKKASLLTNIPEGTISKYYARFNRDKDKYHKIAENGYQKPPKTSPFNAALLGVAYTNILKNVRQFVETGDYAKARDYLQVILLLQDVGNRLFPIMQNFDPEKFNEVIQSLFTIQNLSKPYNSTSQTIEPQTIEEKNVQPKNIISYTLDYVRKKKSTEENSLDKIFPPSE